MLVESEAIVLQVRKYNDTSKIALLYSKEYGKISIIAKGAFTTKSGVSGMLEPLSYVKIFFYKKASSDLHLLKSIEIVTHLNKILKNYNSLVLGLIAAEFTIYSQLDNHSNADIFNNLVNYLKNLNDSESDKQILTIIFLLKLFESTGYLLNFSYVEEILDSSNFSNSSSNNNKVDIYIRDGKLASKPYESFIESKNIYNFHLSTLKKLNNYSKLEYEEVSVESEMSRLEFLEFIDFSCKFLEYHLAKKIVIKSLSLII